MYLIALSGLSYEFGSYFVIYLQFEINTQGVVQYLLDRIFLFSHTLVKHIHNA